MSYYIFDDGFKVSAMDGLVVWLSGIICVLEPYLQRKYSRHIGLVKL